MVSGRKYRPLFSYLMASSAHEVVLTFEKLENIINGALPKSARVMPEWWSNRRKGASQSLSWMEAGYRVVDVDFGKEAVTFRKPVLVFHARQVDGTIIWNAELIKALRSHMGLNQSQFATKLGVRQQTISEWETASYSPSLAMMKLLTFIAKEANFKVDNR